MSLYRDSFDYYGVPVYIEYNIDDESVFTAELIEINGIELLEHLKPGYAAEILQEASDRINGVTPLGAL